MANEVGVRDYLRGLGLDNNQIGYNNGMVQYGGKDLLKAYGDSGAQGRSTASVNDIMSAVNANNLMPQQTGYNTSIKDILGQLTTRINTPFEYDPTTDPRYAAAKQAANRNAEIGSRNAMETMNERGILNSTVTGDRIGQIEQDAQSQVTNLIPSLMADAYNREQGQNQNLLGLLGAYQGLQGSEEQKRQFELNYRMQLESNEDYKALKTQEMGIQSKQNDINNAITRINTIGYADNDTAKILGVPVGTPSAQARQELASAKWVTGSVSGGGASAGLVGFAYIEYVVI